MDALLEKDAVELVELLRSGQVSSRELLAAHLARIAELDPAINAVVTLDADAAERAAAAADDLRASGADLPPLHGLPMTHKDTHLVAGMRSTNGSRVFADLVPENDDLIIARLRAAGVIATGKTNVPEFGAGSHTFNDVFGTTGNPYDTSRSAGGSSGGVAAAIAARVQPLGEGSDMGGSLRIPASFCNVYGFRPSYGVIPCFPAQHQRAWLARQGPMARSVRDLQLFMAATAGPTPVLPSVRGAGPEEFTQESADLRGVRIGVTRDFSMNLPVEPEMLEALDRAIATLTELGAVVEETAPDLSGALEVFNTTRAFDFASSLGPIVEAHPELVKPEIHWNVEQSRALGVAGLLAAEAASAGLQNRLREWFASYDLLLSPGAQVVPFDGSLRYPEVVNGVASTTYLDWMRSACVLSGAGLPTLAMPAGFTAGGLPTGVQISSWHQRDARLLAWARTYDEATRWTTQAPAATS